jgi:hypothetical protein
LAITVCRDDVNRFSGTAHQRAHPHECGQTEIETMHKPVIVFAAAAIAAALAGGDAFAGPGGSSRSLPRFPDTNGQKKLSDNVGKLKLPCLPMPRTNENPTGRSRLGCR